MRDYKQRKNGITINFIIIRNNVHIEQRAEGGGQINRNVGANSNQGGQTAVHGRTANKFSQFANGNGRSGIAGKKNDEQGGQSAIKINKKINKKKFGRRR
ncbi:hypothetical protein [Paenibacillus sp. Soil522]|uniref:hypothetical protein n=1 Tax=Paenibacillus sp. Soil522 TaxID=1736388 RepID=UPI0006FC1166|nr:hypothetical protein [Paenibacillus sp. Soil522]KRE47198.1 hypothetical protein ASG81_10065 [Paenibacillus sp. Soil522]